MKLTEITIIKKIEAVICGGERVSIEAIHTKSRKRELVLPRQIIMYFACELDESLSWAKIGEYFLKDHATAIYAHKTISNLIDTDKNIKIRMKRYKIKIVGVKFNIDDSDKDITTTLENEVHNIENRISKLRLRAELVIAEIERLYVSVKAKKPVAEIKPEIEPIKSEPVKIINKEPVYVSPFAGKEFKSHNYAGYVEHQII